MKTRRTLLLGLAGLGCVLALPVYAAPAYLEDSFRMARNDKGYDPRANDAEADKSRQKRKPSHKTEAGQEPPGYGYGYERRQRERADPRDLGPADRDFRDRR